MPTIACQGHLIGNQWIAPQGEPFSSVSPSDQSVVWEGASATAEQVNAATTAARKAAGPWFDQPDEERMDLVQQFAALVESRADELAELISREMGKPRWESRSEVAAVVGKSAVSIQAYQERRSEQSFEHGNLQAVTRYRPFGVMAVLGPFNLPAHLPNGHIVPALIAGNTIVLKPSEQTPAVGQWIMERWLEAGVPEGVVNLVQGARETAMALANDENLDGLLFTGSSAAGRAIHQTFGQWPQKMLALEMGGNNPLIVHQTDDIQAAAYHVIQSAFITAGQRCTCARRLIVVEGRESEELLSELLDRMPGIRMGYWNDDPQPFAGTLVSREAGARVLQAQESLVSAGAKPISSCSPLRDNEALLSPGLLDVTECRNRPDEEIFGPLLQVVRVGSFEAAIAEANDSKYGMSASLLCEDSSLYRQFIHQIRAGVVNWNRPTTGATGKLPFGGCGLSGNHRPSGYFAADYCNWPIASLEAESLEMPESIATGIDWSR